jgi:hypothetical protein
MRLLSRSVVLVVAGTLLAACGSDTPDAPTSASDPQIDGVQTYSDLSREHTTDTVDYPQSPPVGGDHDPQWVDCTGTVYPDPLRDENAVHALEHGAVWITYDDGLSADEVAALADQVDGAPYTFMSPYPGQPSPVMLTGWGVQLGVDDPTDPRIDEFLTAYRQGPQTPEPGATCEAGEMS